MSFVAALAWAVLLLSALGSIYLTHDLPAKSFLGWIVKIQVRGTGDWPWPVRVNHTDLYYVTRFLVFSFIVVILGTWGYVNLRGNARDRRGRLGAQKSNR